MFYLYVISDEGAGYYASHANYGLAFASSQESATSFPTKSIAEALQEYLTENIDGVSYCEVIDARQ